MEKNNFMIIDDDEDDRFFFKEALMKKRSSAVCLEANNGVVGLEQLRKSEDLPDFIFLDVNMPRMDGLECLKALKVDGKLKHIPVIMYSTSFNHESINEFINFGASGCLNKPTDMNKLPALIFEAIKDL